MKFIKKKFKGLQQKKNYIYQKSKVFKAMGVAYLNAVRNFEQITQISELANFLDYFHIEKDRCAQKIRLLISLTL